MNDFQKISEILPRFLAKQNLAGAAQDEEIKTKFMDLLQEVFGADVSQKIQVVDYKNHTISLSVNDNILAQKIQLSSGILLEKMREMGFANIVRIYSRIEKF